MVALIERSDVHIQVAYRYSLSDRLENKHGQVKLYIQTQINQKYCMYYYGGKTIGKGISLESTMMNICTACFHVYTMLFQLDSQCSLDIFQIMLSITVWAHPLMLVNNCTYITARGEIVLCFSILREGGGDGGGRGREGGEGKERGKKVREGEEARTGGARM